MTSKELSTIEHEDSQEVSHIDGQLQDFEAALLATFERAGLPSENVLVAVRQRGRVFKNLDDALEPLSDERRAASLYISKFLAAVAAGLFDAALNYLWDETIGELRERVAAYELSYFFDLAVGSASEQRKQLNSVEDLTKITDQSLLDGARQLGLLSEVGYKQLDLVRYMRNHASAAHPNQIDLRASQLLEYLEVCITEVICLPQDAVVVEIGRLLRNVKAQKLSEHDIFATGSTFGKLTEEQATSLGDGLAGIYTRLDSDVQTRDNIRLLLPKLWPHLPENARKQFGVRALRFRVNQDREQAELALELLESVDGGSYLPDDLRIPRIQQALEALRTAHSGWNNFANEGPPARELARVVGEPPSVPSSLEVEYVQTLVAVFLTNGHGESWAAAPVYEGLIDSFTPRQAAIALLLVMGEVVSSQLRHSLSEKKWEELLEILEPKLTSRPVKEFFSALKNYGPPIHTARKEGKMRRLAKDLKDSL